MTEAPKRARIGFGLDLSGYRTGKTVLAAINVNGNQAIATILENSQLSTIRQTNSKLSMVVSDEAGDLKKCLAVGPVAVDVPIDLLGLPEPKHAKEIWELTKREVDRDFRALPPLADKIGASVARFRNIMKKLNGKLDHPLYETYPAPFVRQFSEAKFYKSKDEERRQHAFSALRSKLKLDKTPKTDDEFDAVICAIAAVAEEKFLMKITSKKIPDGYRLLKTSPFERIEFRRRNFNLWIEEIKA